MSERLRYVHIGEFVGGHTARYCELNDGSWWFHSPTRGKWLPCLLDHPTPSRGDETTPGVGRGGEE